MSDLTALLSTIVHVGCGDGARAEGPSGITPVYANDEDDEVGDGVLSLLCKRSNRAGALISLKTTSRM